MHRLIVLLAFTCVGLSQALSQDREYGRSMVISDHGIVATSHVLASQAGAQILSQGGSAIDAAIAANAVLGVTEPMMNGIGGDLFLLYWDAKSGKLYGLNASGWAPQGLTIEFLKRQGITVMPDAGIHPGIDLILSTTTRPRRLKSSASIFAIRSYSPNKGWSSTISLTLRSSL